MSGVSPVHGLVGGLIVWTCCWLAGCGAERSSDVAPADRPTETSLTDEASAAGAAVPDTDLEVADEAPWGSRDDESAALAPLQWEPLGADDGRGEVSAPAARSAPPWKESPADLASLGRPEPELALRMADEPLAQSAGPDDWLDDGAVASPPTGDDASSSRAHESTGDAELPFRSVRVFYATDRGVVESGMSASAAGHGWPLLVVGSSCTLLFLGLTWGGVCRRTMACLAVVSLGATVAWGVSGGLGVRPTVDDAPSEHAVRYGNDRGELQLGTCDVTIPWTHQVGEVERPSILRLEIREDARKHIVLQRVERKPDDEYFALLRERIESSPRREVFIFVHGYNVTFEAAARRTAQIAHDVQFAGAPIFFSWPSQGGLLKYAVDENNAQWTVPNLKRFLLDVVHRSGAQSVNLIAHSMGNRALTMALRELHLELAGESTLFNQIILAAPDVDAEIFRRDLAPALVRSAQRVTLYASSNDQALIASRKVHGYARAGESGPGLVVLPGIETIDVSQLDTSFLGHSYYGSSNPILTDIGLLIHQALPAAQRRWLLPQSRGELTYWVFEKLAATAARELAR